MDVFLDSPHPFLEFRKAFPHVASDFGQPLAEHEKSDDKKDPDFPRTRANKGEGSEHGESRLRGEVCGVKFRTGWVGQNRRLSRAGHRLLVP